jgi:hypothetical protein
VSVDVPMYMTSMAMVIYTYRQYTHTTPPYNIATYLSNSDIRLISLVIYMQIEPVDAQCQDSRNRESQKARLIHSQHPSPPPPPSPTTYHRRNNQPIIHAHRPLDTKPRPQPRRHHHTRHNRHGNYPRRRTPSPLLRIDVVGRRPGVMATIRRRKQRWIRSHSGLRLKWGNGA